MAAEIEQEIGVEPTLIAGGGGIFEVHFGDRKLFSKHEQGDRFPAEGQIVKLLQQCMSDEDS